MGARKRNRRTKKQIQTERTRLQNLEKARKVRKRNAKLRREGKLP